MACKASNKTQNATCQTARCFDPRWPPESQHVSTASQSQGWIHRHSVSGACQGYLHHLSSYNTTFSSVFLVVVTLNICHSVGTLKTHAVGAECSSINIFCMDVTEFFKTNVFVFTSIQLIVSTFTSKNELISTKLQQQINK